MRLYNSGGGVVLVWVERDKKEIIYIYGDPRCNVTYYKKGGVRYAVVKCFSMINNNSELRLLPCRYKASVDDGFDELGAAEFVMKNGTEGVLKGRKIHRRRRRRSRKRVKS